MKTENPSFALPPNHYFQLPAVVPADIAMIRGAVAKNCKDGHYTRSLGVSQNGLQLPDVSPQALTKSRPYSYHQPWVDRHYQQYRLLPAVGGDYHDRAWKDLAEIRLVVDKGQWGCTLAHFRKDLLRRVLSAGFVDTPHGSAEVGNRTQELLGYNRRPADYSTDFRSMETARCTAADAAPVAVVPVHRLYYCCWWQLTNRKKD